MKKEAIVTIIGAALIIAGICIGVYAYKSSIAGRSGSYHSDFDFSNNPRMGGDFTLSDHNGKSVNLHDFKGKVTLIFFGYTYCPEICPTGLSDINRALGFLGEEAKDVQTLFISVDPQRDTPEIVGRYVSEFNPTFIGLTGTDEQIRDVARKYAVAYSIGKPDGDGDYDVTHSVHTSLIGRDGNLKSFTKYKTPASELAELIKENL